MRHLCPDLPSVSISGKEGAGHNILVTVALHGNEPCGMTAFNELLQEGYFDRSGGAGWEWPWNTLTVILGNPEGVRRNVRFIDNNLNRLFESHPEYLQQGVDPASEQGRAAVLARAIRGASAYMDLHSASAATPPFAFHHPGCEAARRYSAGFPVAYTVDDPTVAGQGTALEFAQSCGITRAICVECGQHASSAAVQAAKLCIQHFTGGPRRAHGQPCAVTIVGAELVRPGFRWLLPEVAAFQRVAAGEAVAEDEGGVLRCPTAHGAALLLVMPTQAPVISEDAFLWGRPDTLGIDEGPHAVQADSSITC